MIAVVLAAACAMAPADRSWIDRAVAIRAVAERRLLKLPATPPPTIIAIDARCTWTRTARGWRATPHGLTVTLPAGPPQPVGPISFAAPYSGSARGFFAMSLPSVWRAANVTNDHLVPGWQRLAFAPRDPLLAEALLARAAGVSVPRR